MNAENSEKKQNKKMHWLNIARKIIPDFNINL